MEWAPKPQSQESNDSLAEKVKGLESKIKGLNWHRRIAYALAMVGALGFAAEKVDNMANENAKDIIRGKLGQIEAGIDLLKANDLDGKSPAADLVAGDAEYAKEIGSLLDQADKTIFERMISSAEAVD